MYEEDGLMSDDTQCPMTLSDSAEERFTSRHPYEDPKRIIEDVETNARFDET